MTAVVDETTVFELFEWRARADVGEPAGECGAPATGVDHQIGAQLVTRFGYHADHVRHAAVAVVREQAAHGNPAPQVDPGRGGRDRGHGRLHDRPSTGDRLEALVAVANPTGEIGGDLHDRVVAERAERIDGGDHLGKLALEDVAEAGEEVVEHAELVHASALPVRPRLFHRCGRWRGITFEHGHGVAVLREEHRRGLPGHPTADYEDLRHCVPSFGFVPDDSTDSLDDGPSVTRRACSAQGVARS